MKKDIRERTIIKKKIDGDGDEYIRQTLEITQTLGKVGLKEEVIKERPATEEEIIKVNDDRIYWKKFRMEFKEKLDTNTAFRNFAVKEKIGEIDESGFFKLKDEALIENGELKDKYLQKFYQDFDYFLDIIAKQKQEKQNEIEELKAKNEILKAEKEEQAKELERLKAEKPYGIIGSTQLTTNIKALLSYAGTDRNVRGNKNVKVITNKDMTGKTEINFKSRNTDTTITIKDYETIATKQDKNTVKVFNYLLQISNETNYNPEIKFNLIDLVNLGIYKNIQTARQGFINCMDKLLKFEVEGTIKKGKKEIRSKKGYLFYDRDIKENCCIVMRNETINIEFIAQYLTLLPKWSYSLKTDKACNLVDYIFYRARQEIENIKEKGCFNMSFDSINTRLGQPKHTETLKHSQYIITPILEAIEEIENVQNKEKYTDIKLTPIYTEGKVTDFLDGYLKVELMDVSKKYFIEQAIKKENETKKAVEKVEKNNDKNKPKNTL